MEGNNHAGVEGKESKRNEIKAILRSGNDIVACCWSDSDRNEIVRGSQGKYDWHFRGS